MWYSSCPTLTGEPPYYRLKCQFHRPTQVYAQAQVQTYLRNQHPVTGGDAHRCPLAILVESAGADGQDLGLVELLDARFREEDAARRLRLGLDALDQHPV